MISSPVPNVGRQFQQVLNRGLTSPFSDWKMVPCVDFPQVAGDAFWFGQSTLISPRPLENQPGHIEVKASTGIDTRSDPVSKMSGPGISRGTPTGHGRRADG